MHPPEMIPAHPCHSILLADLLANEEIACSDWRIVLGIPGDYLEFVQAHLQGCLTNISGASMNFFLFQINLHHDSHHHLSFSFILPFVKMFECCLSRLHLLELKVLLLAMLVVLLLFSQRHIPIFQHGNTR